jgi:hypothetical protein
MTSTEMAESLLTQCFLEVVDVIPFEHRNDRIMSYSKNLAMMAVDAIIENNNTNEQPQKKIFWYEVKTKIREI